MEMIDSEAKKRDGFKGERMIVLPTETFSAYAAHPLVRRMYLTDIGFFPQARHHYRERRKGIEEYIFLCCTAGEGTVQMKGKEFVLRQNEAICIPHFTGHRYYASAQNPWSILWVHFKGEDTALFPLEDCQVIHFESQSAVERIMHLFELLFQVLDGNYTEGNFVYISQALMLILSETYYREKRNDTEKQNKQVTKVIRYLYKNLDTNLSLEDLTTEFNLSKTYLNGIFQKYTQHAPMDFYLHLKMNHACKLLRLTDLYVYEVAQKLGYQDPYYFSRIFKKMIGCSPRDYRHRDGSPAPFPPQLL